MIRNFRRGSYSSDKLSQGPVRSLKPREVLVRKNPESYPACEDGDAIKDETAHRVCPGDKSLYERGGGLLKISSQQRGVFRLVTITLYFHGPPGIGVSLAMGFMHKVNLDARAFSYVDGFADGEHRPPPMRIRAVRGVG